MNSKSAICRLSFSLFVFSITFQYTFAQFQEAIPANDKMPNKSDKYHTTLLRDELKKIPHQYNVDRVCDDTVISVLQPALFFCYGGNCDSIYKLYFEISGSYGAAATPDSAIVWLMTDDKDGAGPKSSLPDSMVHGHDIRQSSNRARWIGGITPAYISNTALTWITPFSFNYVLPSFWADSGRSICLTPVAWDSTHAGQLFEKDNCFGYGQPIHKIIVPAIYIERFYSCDSGINNLHLIVRGGLPQYNHYNGYGDSSAYDVTVNTSSFGNVHYNDTLIVPVDNQVSIVISDSLSVPGRADGCVIYNESFTIFPQLEVNDLQNVYFDNQPADMFSVSPLPKGAMRIDYLSSDPASDGIYLLNVNGDTVYTQYPLGPSVGPGNIADVPGSLFIYDVPLTGNPYRIVAWNDAGSGWQDSSCSSLENNGYLRLFDMSTGDTLSSKLFPVGDSLCGSSGNFVVDTFGVYFLKQFNKTLLSINGNPSSLSAVDSAGNAWFLPYVAGAGIYQVTFSYNDMRNNLCDLDTIINVIVNSSVGIKKPQEDFNIYINNPVHDVITIQSSKIRIEHIEFYDEMGKLILKKNIAKNHSIDINEYASGVYFMKLFDEKKNFITTKRVIKE